MPSKTNVVIPNARLSYLFVFNKNANDKYSCTILLPKSDLATKKAIDKAIEAARIAGADKFGGKAPANLNTTVYDGDEPKPDGTERGPECKGMWIINASAQQQPGLVDRRCNDIMDSTQLYSGCWANVDVNRSSYITTGTSGSTFRSLFKNGSSHFMLSDGEPSSLRGSPTTMRSTGSRPT